MMRQRFAFLLFLVGTIAVAPALTLASDEAQTAATPQDGTGVPDEEWEELVASVFAKYGHQHGAIASRDTDNNNDEEPKYAHGKMQASPLLESFLNNQDEDEEAENTASDPAAMEDYNEDEETLESFSSDDEEDDEDDDLDVEITLAGPELYADISDDALAFDLGDDILMIVEADDGDEEGDRQRKYVRRVKARNPERRARLREFERRLKSFKIRVLRKNVRKTCKCRTSSLGGCRRCGSKCCHSISSGTVRCREGSRDSCRRIFGKKAKSKFKRKSD